MWGWRRSIGIRRGLMWRKNGRGRGMWRGFIFNISNNVLVESGTFPGIGFSGSCKWVVDGCSHHMNSNHKSCSSILLEILEGHLFSGGSTNISCDEMRRAAHMVLIDTTCSYFFQSTANNTLLMTSTIEGLQCFLGWFWDIWGRWVCWAFKKL